MAGHRDHHSSKQHKLQVVIVPEGNETKGFSVSVVRWHLIAGIVGICVLIAVLAVSAIVFTPLGRLIPVSDAEMASRYGSELVSLQHRVIHLSEEMLVVRDYNKKLRLALGDKTDTDSLLGGLADRLDSAEPEQASPAAAPHSIDTGDQAAPPSANARQRGSSASKRRGAQRQQVESAPIDDGGDTGVETAAAALPVQAATHGAPAFRAAFPISAPVEGYITRTFQNDKMHFGVDYAGKRGTVITAAADGYVIFSNWTQEDGNIIIISHGGGFVTVYQHNQMLLKQQGDFVKRGTPIALLGDSGTTSNGPHLHFEIWKDGQPQNPSDYLIASEK